MKTLEGEFPVASLPPRKARLEDERQFLIAVSPPLSGAFEAFVKKTDQGQGPALRCGEFCCIVWAPGFGYCAGFGAEG